MVLLRLFGPGAKVKRTVIVGEDRTMHHNGVTKVRGEAFPTSVA